MTHDLCAEVRTWMRHAADLTHTPELPAELLAHIAGCTVCRGALLVLRATPLAAPAGLVALSCDACAELLPAYIDRELLAGAVAAARAFPAVAWHLWLCADCAEEHDLVYALATEQAAGRAAPIPAGLPAPTLATLLIARFQLARSRLQALLAPPPAQLGLARGAEADTVVLEIVETSEHLLTLAAELQGDATAVLVVTVEPPGDGSALLTLGGAERRLPLSAGHARSAPIALERLLSSSAPDLVVAVELVPEPR